MYRKVWVTSGFIFFIFLSASAVDLKSYADGYRYLKNLGVITDKVLFTQRPLLDEYDFIVIGAGPGGATVVSRLSENSNWKVLLLEAGPEESEMLKIPALMPLSFQSPVDWDYRTEPQPAACLGLKQRRCVWPRGRALGGTSGINGMVYSRGHRDDYNDWVLEGNNGWSYEEILPYFLKSEGASHKLLTDGKSIHYRGRIGPVSVEPVPYNFNIGYAFFDAMEEMNLPLVDYNNGSLPVGYGTVQLMEKHGLRCSASKAYLEHVRYRKNLHVLTNSFVIKIIIDPVTKMATGVEFYKDFVTHIVTARKEVILSAGVLNSPQLLMLSGIGPKDHLEELGIPVIKDLPVGKYLQDHVTFNGLVFTVNETDVGVNPIKYITPNTLLKFFASRKGPFTNAVTEALGFISTKYNTDNRPDIELMMFSGSFLAGFGARLGLGISDEVYMKVYKPHEGRENWSVFPIIVRPKSRGYMKLQSDNPWDYPLFYPNYLTDEDDVKKIVEGIKFILAMSQTKAMQKYKSKLIDTKFPGCDKLLYGSDDYWKCAVRVMTMPMHHQSGTCKMGPVTDPTAVVSPELKVHGIQNLRVVDSAIIPKPVSAHYTATTFMIAEKGSDLIKATWKV